MVSCSALSDWNISPTFVMQTWGIVQAYMNNMHATMWQNTCTGHGTYIHKMHSTETWQGSAELWWISIRKTWQEWWWELAIAIQKVVKKNVEWSVKAFLHQTSTHTIELGSTVGHWLSEHL